VAEPTPEVEAVDDRADGPDLLGEQDRVVQRHERERRHVVELGGEASGHRHVLEVLAVPDDVVVATLHVVDASLAGGAGAVDDGVGRRARRHVRGMERGDRVPEVHGARLASGAYQTGGHYRR